MVEPVGAVLGDAPRVRRDRGTADQQGAAGYQPRRARRHPRADAAEPLRRRLGDEPRRDRRPAAHAARRWPRDDRDDARLAVERLRRHPTVLRALVEEADSGGSALREATILEVQRTRPVIDLVGRQVKADSLQVGRWTLPKGYAVLVSIALIHDNESLFPNARTFDPHRFLGARPDLYQWIPFGGGTRRCLGAAFANM